MEIPGPDSKILPYASAEAGLVIKNGEGTGALNYQKDGQEADTKYQEAGLESPIGVNAIQNWTEPDGESPKEGTPEVGGLEKKETPTAMPSSGSGSRKVRPAPVKPAPKPMQIPPRNLFKKPAEVQPSTKKAVSGPVGASTSVTTGGKTAVKVGSTTTPVSTKPSPHTPTFKKPVAIEAKPPVKKTTTSGPSGASASASGSGVKITPKIESSAAKKPAGGVSVPRTNVVHKPAQDQDTNNNKKANSGHGTTSKSANLVHGRPDQSQASAVGNSRVLKNNNAVPGPAPRSTGGINKPIIRGQGPTATQSAPHPPPARKIVQKPAEAAGKK